MDYMILDSRGDAVAAFDDETAARATLRAIAQVEPDGARDLVMLAYDDAGVTVGDALTVDDLPLAFSVLETSAVIAWGASATTALCRLPRAEAELDRWYRHVLSSARVTVGDREPQAA
jgi:hypothetical protein